MISYWLVLILITEQGSYFQLLDTYTTLKECRAMAAKAPEQLKNKVACLPVHNYFPDEKEN